jgi:hypothetical protein
MTGSTGNGSGGEDGEQVLSSGENAGAEVISLADYRARGSVPVRGISEVDRWTADLSIAVPEHQNRHPCFLDGVARHVGRICAIDTDVSSRVGMTFDASGDSSEEATADTRAVAQSLLDLLRLDESAILELVVEDKLDIYDVAEDGTFDIYGLKFRIRES